mgnify:CR=1 FL=1
MLKGWLWRKLFERKRDMEKTVKEMGDDELMTEITLASEFLAEAIDEFRFRNSKTKEKIMGFVNERLG